MFVRLMLLLVLLWLSGGTGRAFKAFKGRRPKHGLQRSEPFNSDRCEKLTSPICAGMGYNLTYMPNNLNHKTQYEDGLELHQFWPLLKIQCSTDLRVFLCSVYIPICVPQWQPHIPPCRNVCERAKEGCEALMLEYGFNWPPHLNCTNFPSVSDNEHLCVDPRVSQETASNQRLKNDFKRIVPFEASEITKDPKVKVTEVHLGRNHHFENQNFLFLFFVAVPQIVQLAVNIFLQVCVYRFFFFLTNEYHRNINCTGLSLLSALGVLQLIGVSCCLHYEKSQIFDKVFARSGAIEWNASSLYVTQMLKLFLFMTLGFYSVLVWFIISRNARKPINIDHHESVPRRRSAITETETSV